MSFFKIASILMKLGPSFIKGGGDNKKMFSDCAENSCVGVFRGQELESGARFPKFSSESGEIGPPTTESEIFKNCSNLNATRPKGDIWSVEHESEVRFLKFSSESGEIGPPTAKSQIFKKCSNFNETWPKGDFWGVEHEYEFRFF
jgi:hypothetical protein